MGKLIHTDPTGSIKNTLHLITLGNDSILFLTQRSSSTFDFRFWKTHWIKSNVSLSSVFCRKTGLVRKERSRAADQDDRLKASERIRDLISKPFIKHQGRKREGPASGIWSNLIIEPSAEKIGSELNIQRRKNWIFNCKVMTSKTRLLLNMANKEENIYSCFSTNSAGSNVGKSKIRCFFNNKK